MHNFIAALRWMTILPLPFKPTDAKQDMKSMLPWLPVTGAIVGVVIILFGYMGALYSPWLGALLGTFAWLMITGGLHADGLADLSDAMGASHADKERFLQVLKDSHIGSFGTLALIFIVVSKLVLLKLLIENGLWWALFLIPIWARSGVLLWVRLPAFTDGFAALLDEASPSHMFVYWLIGLWFTSFCCGAGLFTAPVILFLWHMFLKYKIKGMNGDCLGAGIELCEMLLLLVVVVSAV